MSNPGAASTSTTTYVGGGSPFYVGDSAADIVSFYGATGTAQQTKTVAVTTTGSSSTTNAFGYTTSTQADAIVTAINAIITQLTNLGLTT